MPYTLAGALVCLAGFSGQTRWLALFAGNPTESGAEVSATGYARLLRSSSQMTVTDNELSVSMGEWDDSTNATWGTPDHVAFMTAATGGTILAYTPLSPALSAAIAAGDRVFTEEGDIRMQIPIDEEDLEVVPTGMVAPFAGNSAPDGWLFTDGGAYSRTGYANLFAVIGTDYGEGDGSTTFNVPNTTGQFPLGAGDGRSRRRYWGRGYGHAFRRRNAESYAQRTEPLTQLSGSYPQCTISLAQLSGSYPHLWPT